MDVDNLADTKKMLRYLLETVDIKGVPNKIAETIKIAAEQMENYAAIDQEMVQILQSYLGNDLVQKDNYGDIVKAVGEGSVIVYFKSAQLFKIYKKEELDTLLGGQLRTIYRRINQSFEVVPDLAKQKIIILGDASLLNSIDKIKLHIMLFMREKGIINFKEDDIVCFTNGNTIEIIINNYYVTSSQERHSVVADLLSYIFKKEKNNNITRQLTSRIESEFDGASMITMPNEKQLITHNFVEYIDSLVGNVEKCTRIGRDGNTYITFNVNVQNQNAEVINNADVVQNVGTINNVDAAADDMQNIGDFGKYIIENKPLWYKPGKSIEKNVLHDKYMEVFGDISKINFHKAFSEKIFKNSVRVTVKKVKITKVTMLKYNEIQTLDDF